MITGTMYNFLKDQKLTTKWELKKQGIDPTDPRKQLIEDAKRQREATKMANIDGKLKSGKKLSTKELEYLKEKSPGLYQKAVKIAIEREEYEKKLKSCRSKDEVEKLRDEKLQQFCNEAKAIQGSGMPAGQKQQAMDELGMRMSAHEDAYKEFRASDDYKKLPQKTKKQAEQEENLPRRLHLRA